MIDICKISGEIRMLREYALVRHIGAVERKTAGGIIVPGTAKETLMTGEIVACGAGYISADKSAVIPLDIAKGDIVLFNDWAMGKPIEYQGEVLYIMEEADMHGVIDKGAA